MATTFSQAKSIKIWQRPCLSAVAILGFELKAPKPNEEFLVLEQISLSSAGGATWGPGVAWPPQSF